MALNKTTFEAYVKENRERFLDEFRQLIAIPSVVADGRGIEECADWVVERFRKIGADVRKIPTPNNGSPVVVAEVGQGPRTMMIYNHYDVQPETPLELWNSPPFELTAREGFLFGRGVADDKGELLSRIQAVETWQQTQGELPVRLKFVVEGEEEIASVNFPQWVEDNRELLTADDLLWEGGGFDEQGNVSMAEGCKGIAYFELTCRAASHDLHSSLAPLVPNPAWRLVWALSTMKDQHDRITIDGYLDHVRDMPEDVLERIDSLPFDSAKMKQIFGIKDWVNGMDDTTARRRYLLEPTMTICGLNSGYTGTGSKTVLPAEARVKIDCRLVPDLTPELAQELIRKHLEVRGFDDIAIALLGGEEPVMELRESSIRQAAIAASEKTFGKTPVISPWFPGSGPMYPLSVKLDIPVISAGATWHPNSRIHSPNENILEEKYFLGISFIGSLIDAYRST